MRILWIIKSSVPATIFLVNRVWAPPLSIPARREDFSISQTDTWLRDNTIFNSTCFSRYYSSGAYTELMLIRAQELWGPPLQVTVVSHSEGRNKIDNTTSTIHSIFGSWRELTNFSLIKAKPKHNTEHAQWYWKYTAQCNKCSNMINTFIHIPHDINSFKCRYLRRCISHRELCFWGPTKIFINICFIVLASCTQTPQGPRQTQ